MVNPLTPNQVTAHKKVLLPDAIIECWNGLIAKNWDGYVSIVHQSEAVRLLMEVMDCGRDEVITNKWLDIEDIYRESGWKVVYDRPGYNENYSATFNFRKNL
jgi:hypothetical protein